MLRIGGLASGMDIESIVKNLIQAERMPLDKLKQKKQTLEWQRDDFRAMNTLMLDFRNQISNMRLPSRYQARQVSSTDESKLSVTTSSGASQSSYAISKVSQLASAETKVNAAKIHNGSFDPNKSLYSQNANFAVTGNHIWLDGAVQSKSISITANAKEVVDSELAVALQDSPNHSAISVKVNGHAFKVTASETPEENEVFLDTVNNKLIFGKELTKGSAVKVDYIAQNRTDSFNVKMDTTSWQLAQGAINGDSLTKIKYKETTGEEPAIEREFDVVASDDANTKNIMDGTKLVGTLNLETGNITFNSDMPKPEKDSNTVISLEATYNHKYTTFSMDTSTSKGPRHETFIVTGSESLNSVVNKVNASNVGVSMFYDTFSGQMTLTRKETGDFNPAGEEITTTGSFLNEVLQFGSATVKEVGKNAVFEVNGLETQRTSNTFSLNGVTFTIKQKFEEAVNVNVSNDSQKVFDNIKGFIEKYNEMIDTIQKKTNESVYRSYQPLTDEQKEQLSDKQQEQWEEKAKSGLLRRDSTLTNALSEMRMDFYNPVGNVSGLYNQLAKIGITTSSNYLEGGKLHIDETKLKAAIEADPESVENLFRADVSTASEKGIINRLYDTATKTMDKLRVKAGNSFSTNQQFTIGKELIDIDKRIDRFEDRLTQLEDRYWSQFTAMEKAVQRANEQSAYLMQQFSM